jgi:UDP-glucose:glycoprotein glucosyltransferase
MDLSNAEDLELLVGQIQAFVKRKLPIRFGFVPLAKTSSAIEQAKIAYHLLDSYGLSATMTYLGSLRGAKKVGSATKASFENAVKDRKL